MKLTKTFSIFFATAAALTFAVAPALQTNSAQPVQATRASDLPEGSFISAPGKVLALNYEAGETSVFLWSFDGNSKHLDNRGVQNNSWWRTDGYRVLDGEKYYRVSTNEWINYYDLDDIEFDDGSYLLGIQIQA